MPPGRLIMFYILWVTSFNCAHSKVRKKNRMNSLMQYITKEAGKHQVMFLIDEESMNQGREVNNFVQKVSRNFPTFTTTINQAIESQNDSKHVGQNPRATTLFTIVLNSQEESEITSHLQKPFKFLSDLSFINARPKCLIVHFLKDRNMSYENVIKNLTLQKFVDVSVLEVSESGLLPKCDLSKGFAIQWKKIATLHHFNPYSKIYSKEKSLKKTEWFPDKGKNFYMKKIKILRSIKNNKRNRFVEILARNLNFSIKYVKAKEGWRSLLRQNKAQFFLLPMQYYHAGYQRQMFISRVMYLESVKVLVPKIPIPYKISPETWRIIYAFVGNAVIIFVLRITLLALKFNNDLWQMLNIMGALIGLGFPTVPTAIKERIVFIFLLVTCMVYSGELHLMLTDIKLRPIPIKEINTIEDLSMSGLPLYTSAYFLLNKALDDDDPDYLKQLSHRSYQIKINFKQRNCVSQLMKYKNVTCSFPSSVIYNIMKLRLKKKQKLEMKIVDETLTYFATSFMLESGAPYVENFNKEILRMIEVGVMSKFNVYKSYIPAILKEKENYADTSDVFRQRILIILVAGYIIGSVVFILEHLCNYFLNRLFRFLSNITRL